tara:strand:- start:400 stop:750 length:351 start_codon:yes stop_codon:yes gene_type:complete
LIRKLIGEIEMNLAESIAQYTVNSFASFLEEEATSVGTMGGVKTKGNGGKGKGGKYTGVGAPAAVSAGRDDESGEAGEDGNLAAFLAAWGSANPDFDFDGDGTVTGADLAIMLGRG